MIRPTLLVLATCCALATPAAPAVAAPSITGTWQGRVINQDGPAGYAATIRLTRAKGTYRASVDYTRGVAPTRWVYRGHRGSTYRFREVSGGTAGAVITVRREGARLLVRYRVPELDYRGHIDARRLR